VTRRASRCCDRCWLQGQFGCHGPIDVCRSSLDPVSSDDMGRPAGQRRRRIGMVLVSGLGRLPAYSSEYLLVRTEPVPSSTPGRVVLRRDHAQLVVLALRLGLDQLASCGSGVVTWGRGRTCMSVLPLRRLGPTLRDLACCSDPTLKARRRSWPGPWPLVRAAPTARGGPCPRTQ
jgi:hypothetical protein